jgi:hypothetical protein
MNCSIQWGTRLQDNCWIDFILQECFADWPNLNHTKEKCRHRNEQSYHSQAVKGGQEDVCQRSTVSIDDLEVISCHHICHDDLEFQFGDLQAGSKCQ